MIPDFHKYAVADERLYDRPEIKVARQQNCCMHAPIEAVGQHVCCQQNVDFFLTAALPGDGPEAHVNSTQGTRPSEEVLRRGYTRVAGYLGLPRTRCIINRIIKERPDCSGLTLSLRDF